jgi:glutamate-ammonia-ligase adenylyltransferase
LSIARIPALTKGRSIARRKRLAGPPGDRYPGSMMLALKPLPDAPHAAILEWAATLPPECAGVVANAMSSIGPLLAAAPYLFEQARHHADWLASMLDGEANTSLAMVLAEIRVGGQTLDLEADLAVQLRVAKGRIALLAAIAETGAAWTTAEATAALSDLADAALEASVDFLIRKAAERGAIRATSAADCGLTLFALGKHGGRELNYSSDIDIVAFFDAERGVLADPSEATKFYTGIVRRVVALMEERGAGGYVFRTDLRLRPDPGSTPIALSIDAALAYYEVRGQNWERAAWIKARPCAGDLGVGEVFLKLLAPYIWRRHLDFATIADIQAMKRQINVAKNVGAARVEGHNVKLGRGGIREIEFFTQTQQLIAGGREPSLRVRPTTVALKALAMARWITPEAARELTATYWFLRAVENRLQMLNDAQTHVMPEDAAGVAVIARLMGEANLEAFETRYRTALSLVMRYYAGLFSEEETLGGAEGNLVFTGSDDDPGTLDTLSGMGFADPHRAAETVRKWHYGSYAATRTAAARAHLTELLPSLLKTIAAAGDADETLRRFDDFLSRLPAGIQFFALVRSHAQLLTLLVELLASAPRLAEAVIHRAHVMDGLIDPAFANEVSRQEVLVGKIENFFAEARDYQDVIDRARIIGQEQKFLIAAGLLSGTLEASRAAEQFTALAETLLKRLFATVRTEFSRRHGVVPGARTALLGFGKMASREMTFTSDLDFIMLYDGESSTLSDGDKPLAASHYFARLTQRLIAAVSAPTAEGVLYETDMRLRPSGNAGPLATSLSGFADYHRRDAWTWEHLALSRARVIVADGEMLEAVDAVIAAQMADSGNVPKRIEDVISMRALMAKERPARHPLDLKLATGGLIDLEFIAQSAQVVAAARLGVPQASTAVVLDRLTETGLLAEGERLALIHGVYSSVLEVASAALLNPFRDEEWSAAFKELLARLTHYPSFERLSDDLIAMRGEVEMAAAKWYVAARLL